MHVCLVVGGVNDELRDHLVRGWYSDSMDEPWILFVNDHALELLSVCRVESDRSWARLMFDSIADHGLYAVLVASNARQQVVLEARRRRVRNSLVHGSPASFAVTESVRSYAEFLARSALRVGLDAYFDDAIPGDVLRCESPELSALSAGTDAATFWRRQAKPV